MVSVFLSLRLLLPYREMMNYLTNFSGITYPFFQGTEIVQPNISLIQPRREQLIDAPRRDIQDIIVPSLFFDPEFREPI